MNCQKAIIKLFNASKMHAFSWLMSIVTEAKLEKLNQSTQKARKTVI